MGGTAGRRRWRLLPYCDVLDCRLLSIIILIICFGSLFHFVRAAKCLLCVCVRCDEDCMAKLPSSVFKCVLFSSVCFLLDVLSTPLATTASPRASQATTERQPSNESGPPTAGEFLSRLLSVSTFSILQVFAFSLCFFLMFSVASAVVYFFLLIRCVCVRVFYLFPVVLQAKARAVAEAEAKAKVAEVRVLRRVW